MLSQSGVDEITANEVSTTCSWYQPLNIYGEGTEVYTVIFNSCYTGLDGYTLSDSGTVQPANVIPFGELKNRFSDIYFYPSFSEGIGYLTNWTDFLTAQVGFSSFGETNAVDYLNKNGTTSTIQKFDFYFSAIVRFDVNRNTKGNTVFQKTLERKKNNKVKEIRLYDHKGTLMSFRKAYIIDGQIYKLLSYEFEPISKLVIAKIILK